MEIRPYQQTAIRAVQDEFASGIRSTLLVMATGLGKTFCFTELAKFYRGELRKPVLVLAHRTELLEQASKNMHRAGLRFAIEKADQRAYGRGADVVIASVQTMMQPKRLARWTPDYFGLIVVDEAHHAVSSSYRKVIDHFDALLLGVTATPNRHDEIGLKHIFQTCAFQYTIQDGIKDDWLCPVKGKQVEVAGLHLEQLKVVAGEFAQPQLDAMLRDEENLQGMVLPTLQEAGDRPTIVFTPGVEHAHEIAACFNRLKPNSAVAIDGGMDADTRKYKLRQYESGRAQFLCNVGICTEGYDHPPTACIALFRPTKSLGLCAQMIGRGTRLKQDYSDCLVLDFVGVNNTVRTVTVMDVLDGTKLSDAEHKKAQELQKQGYGAIDALAKAKTFVAGLDSIRAKMRAFTTCNAFDVLGMFAIPSQKGMYGGDRATDRQRAYLEGRGLKVPAGLEKGEASALIDKFVKRQDQGLATFKQMKYLKQLGYQTNEPEKLTFAEAGKLINDILAKRKPRPIAVNR